MSGTQITFPTGFNAFTPALSTVYLAAANSSTLGSTTLDLMLSQITSSHLANAGVLTRQISYGSGGVTVAPTGNPSIGTVAALSVQVTTAYSGFREFVVNLGMTVNLASPDTGSNNDKVTLYVGAETAFNNHNLGWTWAINSVTNINPGGNAINAWGYELDFNNFSFDAHNITGTNLIGMGITGASNNYNTGGLLFSENNPYWWRGIFCVVNAIGSVFIQDGSQSPTVLQAYGSHSTGIDFTAATLPASQGGTAANFGAMALASGMNIYWHNPNGSNVVISADSSNNLLLGSGGATAGCFLYGTNILPGNGNRGAGLGGATDMWAACYAATFSSASDGELKTNVQPIPLEAARNFYKALKPVFGQWKEGGHTLETYDEEYDEHVHDQVPYDVPDDYRCPETGKMIHRTKQILIPEPQFIHEPKHDDSRQPILDRTLQYDSAPHPDGAHFGSVAVPRIDPVTGEHIAIDVPRIHREPVMRKATRKAQRAVPRPGVRYHAWLVAQDVKTALDDHLHGSLEDGKIPDLALYGHDLTPEGDITSRFLNMEQNHPFHVLMVQDLMARLEKAEAKLEAMEAAKVAPPQ